jgi:hypothetical protein
MDSIFLKEKFIALLRSTGREGMEGLINYLDNDSDFFVAPASTKYHGAYPSGLLEHSIDVYENLKLLCASYEREDIARDSIIIVSLLHDLCKVNFYKSEVRNRKNEKGYWEPVQVYSIDDELPLGHGEKSVFIAQQYIKLKIDEAMAIRWHMGGFAATDYAASQSISKAMEKYPLVTLTHMADLAAGYLNNR